MLYFFTLLFLLCCVFKLSFARYVFICHLKFEVINFLEGCLFERCIFWKLRKKVVYFSLDFVCYVWQMLLAIVMFNETFLGNTVESLLRPIYVCVLIWFHLIWSIDDGLLLWQTVVNRSSRL